MDGITSIAHTILNTYAPIYKDADLEGIASNKIPLHLPQFSSEEIEDLCKQIQEIFAKEPVCLELDGPVNIFGDLHGHLLDLFRDLQNFGMPELQNRFLFLGDIVDRGEFSMETVTLVFALKVVYPDNVFIIRGNHEFSFLNERCGFQDDILKIYGGQSTLYTNFKAVFSFMPITAIVCKTIICVHGGLGPSWFSVNQAKKIERPIDDFGEDLLDAMLWSDPSEAIDYFEPSNRGTGFFFGESVLTDFLDSNSLKLIVRAHECVNNGTQFMFNNKLLTVFGASNYCGLISNNSGILCVNENGDFETKQYAPLQYLKRDCVTFQKVVDGKLVTITQKRIGTAKEGGRPNIPKLPPLNCRLNSTNKVMTPHQTEIKVHKPVQPSTARPRWSESPRNHFRVPR